MTYQCRMFTLMLANPKGMKQLIPLYFWKFSCTENGVLPIRISFLFISYNWILRNMCKSKEIGKLYGLQRILYRKNTWINEKEE